MEMTTMEYFLAWYGKIRKVTNEVLKVVPPGQLDWTYMSGKFTIGDLIRHIAAIERLVFAEIAIGNKPAYKGCGKDLADGYENVIRHFNEMHRQSVEIFKSIPDQSLEKKVKSVDGKEIELGNFLRALIVHEIHHRGALCIYLNILGVTTPPVIGLMEEQVIQFSK